MSGKANKFSKKAKLLSRLPFLRKPVLEQKRQTHTSNEEFNTEQIEEVPEKQVSEWTISVLQNDIKQQLLQSLRHPKDIENLFSTSTADELKDYFRNTPAPELCQVFLWSAFLGRLDCLRILHEMGVDQTYCHEVDQLNALHLSAFYGSAECCRWLLTIDQRLWQDTASGLSPFHYAVLGNSKEVVTFFIASDYAINHTVLSSAVYSNSVDCLELLVSQTEVNTFYDGMTMLHSAVDLNHIECIKFLLKDPAIDVNLKAHATGNTALHFAAENGYVECVELLLRRGAEVAEVNSKKQTALHLACKMQHIDCVKYLLQHNAPVNAKDIDQRTPLHDAIKESPSSVVIAEALVKWEADVNVADRFHYTPLHMAAINEMEDCVNFLILNGANVTAKNKGGITALSIIQRKIPACTNSIQKRLTLSLAYNSGQNLKFSFRDLLTNSSIGETGYLYTLIGHGEEKILEHPICRAFLYLKWKRVRAYYILRILLSLIAVTLVNLYVFATVMREDCCFRQREAYSIVEDNLIIPDNEPSHTVTNTDHLIMCNIKAAFNVSACHRYLHFRKRVSSIIPVYAGMKLIKGLIIAFVTFYSLRLFFTFPLYSSFKRFLNLLEILEVTITISLILYFVQINGSGLENDAGYYCQKFLGVMIVFLSWMHLLVMNGQQFFRSHVVMFEKVSYESLKLLFVYCSLLFGFTCTFCILFQNLIPDFDNPIFGFIKVFAMMTGEINFSDITGKLKASYTRGMAFLFLALFIILITFVLMNLMVGIAVNDVEGLYKTAKLEKLVQQTQAIHFLEVVCFNGFFPPSVRKLLHRTIYLWPNSYKKVIYVRTTQLNKQILPKDIIEEGIVFALSKRKTETAEEKLSRKVKNLKKKVIEIQGTLSRVNQRMEQCFKESRELVRKIDTRMESMEERVTELSNVLLRLENVFKKSEINK